MTQLGAITDSQSRLVSSLEVDCRERSHSTVPHTIRVIFCISDQAAEAGSETRASNIRLQGSGKTGLIEASFSEAVAGAIINGAIISNILKIFMVFLGLIIRLLYRLGANA